MKIFNMLQKINLANITVFWASVIFFVFILVFVNNYFFYKYINGNTIRNTIILSKQINEYYSKCKENKTDLSICQEALTSMAQSYAKRFRYNKSFIIKATNGNIIWQKMPHSWENPVNVDVIFSVPDDYSQKSIKLKSDVNFDLYLVFTSTLQSITFSVYDMAINYFEKVYSPEAGKFEIVTKSLEKKSKKYTYYKINGKEFFFAKSFTLKVDNGDNVKKGDVIAEGNLLVALNNFVSFYYYRSMPAACYILFSFIVCYLVRKREISILNKQKMRDMKMLQDFNKEKSEEKQKIIKTLEENKDKEIKLILQKIQISNEEELKLLHQELETLKRKPISAPSTNETSQKIIRDFVKYDHLINPPLNISNYERMFDIECHGQEIGIKFRRVAEKITFQLYEKYIGKSSEILPLGNVIWTLRQKNIISRQAESTLHLIRIYGNKSAHYNLETTNTNMLDVAAAMVDCLKELSEKLEPNASTFEPQQLAERVASKRIKEPKKKFPNAKIIKLPDQK